MFITGNGQTRHSVTLNLYATMNKLMQKDLPNSFRFDIENAFVVTVLSIQSKDIDKGTTWGVQHLMGDEGSYLPNCKTSWVIALHALALLFWHFH